MSGILKLWLGKFSKVMCCIKVWKKSGKGCSNNVWWLELSINGEINKLEAISLSRCCQVIECCYMSDYWQECRAAKTWLSKSLPEIQARLIIFKARLHKSWPSSDRFQPYNLELEYIVAEIQKKECREIVIFCSK